MENEKPVKVSVVDENVPRIDLVQQEFHTITRSYARKINLANYVKNHDYESVDLFSSHNEQLPVEAEEGYINAVSKKLFEMSKADVDAAAQEIINAYKREAGVTIEPTGEDYKQIADIIVMLESSVTDEDIKKAVEIIKEKKDGLNATQLDYLRYLRVKAEARLLG